MGFEGLRFFNFRNLNDAELSLGAREIFLVGENGQGKTNLLEAVHLLCLGSSFREKREAALFR
ncbi:MAG: AAA family ATPase, partial [Methanothrix sp.]|nr:AAA family ATPase [Methanothrix sp.]